MDNDKSNLKKQHRDTMFRGHFKIPGNFLQLLKHCSHQDTTLTTDDITPFDLESAVAVRIRRNDVSFITKDNRLIILIEHQSTLNPNMALRLFLYYIELLQLWIKLNNINLYGESKITTLPVPEFYVAYNGVKPLEEDISEFYIESECIQIKATVNIVNIHYDKLNDTKPSNALAGYSFFYKIFDEGKQAGLSPDEAFNEARKMCIANGYLKDFIDREEFIMFYKDILDYDTQLKEEGKREGKIEGKREGKREGRIEGKREGKIEGKREGKIEGLLEGFKKLKALTDKGHSMEEAIQMIKEEELQASPQQ